MEMPKIEHGIPIPDKALTQFGKYRELIATMKVGDSFLVKSTNEVKRAMKVNTTNGLRLTSRKINGSGWRLWRVK